MKHKIRRCSSCKIYTLKSNCPRCSSYTHEPHPPKYSPEDRYASYRSIDRYEDHVNE